VRLGWEEVQLQMESKWRARLAELGLQVRGGTGIGKEEWRRARLKESEGE